MTDYTSLANSIKSTLAGDSWLGDHNNVKTMEIHKRGFSLQDEKDALYFAPADLPALAIVPNAAAKEQAQTTTNEIEEITRSQVITISRGRDVQVDMDRHLEIVNNVERVLDKQKSSTDNLGIDAFVRAVSTTEQQFKKGNYYYFISTTEARIELTATF